MNDREDTTAMAAQWWAMHQRMPTMDEIEHLGCYEVLDERRRWVVVFLDGSTLIADEARSPSARP